MANSDSSKDASDQSHESYADDAKARRVLLVDSSGNSTPLKFVTENNATGMVVYFGEAAPGTLKSQALWRIYKLTYDANNGVTEKEWADGVASFTKEWDERATYTYTS